MTRVLETQLEKNYKDIRICQNLGIEPTTSARRTKVRFYVLLVLGVGVSNVSLSV
jgi:hypothetical protein